MATPSTLNGEIAVRVRGAADDAQITQQDLALKAGIPDRTFARLLAGQSDWRVSQVNQVADALGLDLHDLLMGRAA
jgi:predicted transcriptional regulator